MMTTLQFVTVSLILVNEALCTTMMFPFVGLFVVVLNPSIDRSTAGYFSGVLIGAFQGAQSIFCSHWGKASDKVGRKPIFVFGLCCGAICVFLLGISTNLWMAMLFRCLHGMFAANAPLAKTYVAEVADKDEQARAFGLLSVTWALGAFVGPMLGGFLYDPSTSTVLSRFDLFSKDSVFARHPAMLPCSVVSLYTFTAALLVVIHLPESNSRAIPVRQWLYGLLCNRRPFPRREMLPTNDDVEEDESEGNEHQVPSVSESLSSDDEYEMVQQYTDELSGGMTTSIAVEEKIVDHHHHRTCHDRETSTLLLQPPVVEDMLTEIPVDGVLSSDDSQMLDPLPCCQQSGGIAASTEAISSPREPSPHLEEPHHNEEFTWSDLARHPVLSRCVPMYMVLCAYNIVFSEVMPLYGIAYAKDGGLEMTSEEVGVFFTINAGVSVIMNLVFPLATARWGTLILWRFCSVMFAVSVMCYGLATHLNSFHSVTLTLVYLGLCSLFRCTASTWAFSMSMMFVANAAPPHHLGRVTGMSHACGSLMRSLWPILAAPIFAWSIAKPHPFPFNYYFVFVICAMLSLFGYYLSTFLKEDEVIKKDKATATGKATATATVESSSKLDCGGGASTPRETQCTASGLTTSNAER